MKPKKRIPGQSIRNTWQINPRTRIHENDIRKNKKKERQLAQKEVGNLMKRTSKGTVPNDLNQWTAPFNFICDRWFRLSDIAAKQQTLRHAMDQGKIILKKFAFQQTF